MKFKGFSKNNDATFKETLEQLKQDMETSIQKYQETINQTKE